MWYESLLAKNLFPDFVIREGIRLQLANRLRKEHAGGLEVREARMSRLVDELRQGHIAVHTAKANEQHYEVPAEFFQAVLGKHLKYSCGYWPDSAASLDDAEEAMLELTCERAQVRDGQEILDMGCGWGSLSLYLAEKFPRARITGVSNSVSQKVFIDGTAARRGLTNVTIVTCDMNEFQTQQRFDRILSIEMLEHMRNYEQLFHRAASWMKDDGLFFAHVFCHGYLAYAYDETDMQSWMARHFFTGGLMPSQDLLLHFQKDLALKWAWVVDGKHYQKTCEAWLAKMDRRRAEILPVLEKTYGPSEAPKWWAYWRIFFMACSELFGYRSGEEWFVAHYLFEKHPLACKSAGIPAVSDSQQ